VLPRNESNHVVLDQSPILQGESSNPISQNPHNGLNFDITLEQFLEPTTSIVPAQHSTSAVTPVSHPKQAYGPRPATRKRARSPSPILDQQLTTIRKLSKHTGAKQEYFNVLTTAMTSISKRQRSEAQTRNREKVMEKGGSCLLCFIQQKMASTSSK
jgi:hypothetical protein